VLIGLNMMVVVEPHQQAVKLAGGRIVDDRVFDSGVLWKLPWPFETAEVYDVTRIRSLPLTAQEQFPEFEVSIWDNDLNTDLALEPFIVAASQITVDSEIADQLEELAEFEIERELDSLDDSAEETVEGDSSAPGEQFNPQTVRSFALVDSVITLQYRIRSAKTGGDENGLLKYLNFAPDIRRPREQFTVREASLKSLALREISMEFATLTMDEVLVGADAQRAGLVSRVEERVQKAFDDHNTGIEVIAINIPVIRPSGAVGKNYVDLMIAMQQRRELISQAEQRRITTLTFRAGSLDSAEAILAEIETWKTLRRELGSDAQDVVAQRLRIQQMLEESGGESITSIIRAERDRWVQIMAARSQVSHVSGELPAYLAAPELYRERAVMTVLTRSLDGVRKFFVGIDPARFDATIDYKELDTVFGIAPQGDEAITGEGGMGP
jgi:regulator of protease activity HflC (stomatin/prohibitin superfamily)